MQVLSFFADLPFSTYQTVIPGTWTALLAGLGILFLLAPRGIPARWLGLVMVLPVLWVKFDRPVPGTFWFSLLDVGQGLAAVVQTHEHVLVYDTGAQFSNRFNAGDAVLVPFLRQAGYSRINRLVISHGDNDHIGGAFSLLQQIPAGEIFSSVPNKLLARNIEPVNTCYAGQSWLWDDVTFEFIHPEPDYLDKHNDSSCVLMITADGVNQRGSNFVQDNYDQRRVLLTGDIEKAAEALLVRDKAEQLQADILIVPHHGSKTSSTADFIRAVSPQYALFPVGHLNRYRFPHSDILKRYQAQGIQTVQVAETGAIHFVVGDSKQPFEPDYHRQTHRAYWHKY